ncbi:helix-turn-helix domain-containing protein [Streptomyces mirabilis]|uniref:helix-turn-helix domain-containing protein n=1 Tax=Streptomyces mirabilis TaxID=68239 RepID=UPI0033D09E72
MVEVIGAALELKATGAGHRTIAVRLGRPPTTVRGWLRRFAARAARVAGVFTSYLVTLVDDPAAVLPAPAGSAFADAVAAVLAATIAVRSRFVATAPMWRVASAVSRGALLAPGWPAPAR